MFSSKAKLIIREKPTKLLGSQFSCQMRKEKHGTYGAYVCVCVCVFVGVCVSVDREGGDVAVRQIWQLDDSPLLELKLRSWQSLDLNSLE